MGRARWPVLFAGMICAAACDSFHVKVPITDVHAGFTLADATWFEEEQTLFVFYRVDAEQGLGPYSQLEIAWRTDEADQPWTPLQDLPPVHTHVPVDCGHTQLCGSTSLHVPVRPRNVQLRLRYHRDGALTLDAPVTFNVIGKGPPAISRSLLVYGVFDETNTHVQWRARHQFPGVRNEEAQALGLRRHFEIADQGYGDLAGLSFEDDPYGYGLVPDCPGTFTPLGWPAIQTETRAMFDPHLLPVAADAAPALCARSTVTDATGTFTAVAIARKNPEVEPAFPALRSPIVEDTPIRFFLRICDREISEPHREMQIQRLLLDGAPEVCLDDWKAPGFAQQLAARFSTRIDQVRAEGRDMVLVFSLHHDDATGQLATVVEDALSRVLPFERDKSSPRVVGAFVFDSFSHLIGQADLKRLVLWCPATLVTPPTPAPAPDAGEDPELEEIPDASQRTCPLLPDRPDLQVGPVRFNQLPILPTRSQYLKFIDKYGESVAGHTKTLTFKGPVRTPLSENIPVGEFSVATFFNNEVMTAAPTDRFSFCPSEDPAAQAVVFRVSGFPDPIPLSMLPQVQEQFPQPAYWLGLTWDFPFLTRLEYETFAAGAATAVGFTVPFGISSQQEAYFGNAIWQTGEFRLSELLTRCTRFCTHPTFDSAGVYNVLAPFASTFRDQCYRPSYPKVDDGGFPRDP
ncbi:MAG: hypothetical protein IRZ16_20955 [Myxococcaceae bacterium]|nr:hypothetical protein [Myxococcaceae bacterium]